MRLPSNKFTRVNKIDDFEYLYTIKGIENRTGYFKKPKKTDVPVYESKLSTMDFYLNGVGVIIGTKNNTLTEKEITRLLYTKDNNFELFFSYAGGSRPLTPPQFKKICYDLLKEYKEKMDINYDIDLVFKPYTNVDGYCYNKQHVIGINKYAIFYDKDYIKEIIVHELTHMKHKGFNHDETFNKQLKGYLKA